MWNSSRSSLTMEMWPIPAAKWRTVTPSCVGREEGGTEGGREGGKCDRENDNICTGTLRHNQQATFINRTSVIYPNIHKHSMIKSYACKVHSAFHTWLQTAPTSTCDSVNITLRASTFSMLAARCSGDKVFCGASRKMLQAKNAVRCVPFCYKQLTLSCQNAVVCHIVTWQTADTDMSECCGVSCCDMWSIYLLVSSWQRPSGRNVLQLID